MNEARILFNLIDEMLKGVISFPEFADRYYDWFHDMPDISAVGDDEFAFLDSVAEVLDYSDKDPDSESRSYGYMTYDEARQRIQQARETYQARVGRTQSRPHADAAGEP